jgi:hypothetical protein
MKGSENVELEPTDSEKGGLTPVDMELKNISNLVREGGSGTIKGLHANDCSELLFIVLQQL